MLKRIPNLRQFRRNCESDKTRWGSIVVLAAGMIVMVFGFLAFSVDVGYIALTKAQLEDRQRRRSSGLPCSNSRQTWGMPPP